MTHTKSGRTFGRTRCFRKWVDPHADEPGRVHETPENKGDLGGPRVRATNWADVRHSREWRRVRPNSKRPATGKQGQRFHSSRARTHATHARSQDDTGTRRATYLGAALLHAATASRPCRPSAVVADGYASNSAQSLSAREPIGTPRSARAPGPRVFRRNRALAAITARPGPTPARGAQHGRQRPPAAQPHPISPRRCRRLQARPARVATTRREVFPDSPLWHVYEKRRGVYTDPADRDAFPWPLVGKFRPFGLPDPRALWSAGCYEESYTALGSVARAAASALGIVDPEARVEQPS